MLEFSILGHEEAADIPQFVHPRIPNEVISTTMPAFRQQYRHYYIVVNFFASDRRSVRKTADLQISQTA